MEIIAEKRGISNYFLAIHGSPNKKSYWTEYLIEKHNLNRNETIFLGDATTDLDAANFSKTHFALRENEENSNQIIKLEDQLELLRKEKEIIFEKHGEILDKIKNLKGILQ